MAERRSLTEGLKVTPPPLGTSKEREFVYGDKAPVQASSPPARPRAPLSTRIRSDYAVALKRASLERQLKAVEPNTLQDILEEALEPWLRANGYLS